MPHAVRIHEIISEQPTLCPYELSSLRAMTTYVAQNRNLQENVIETMVKAKFGVTHIAQLRHENFRDAITFLIDLRAEERESPYGQS